MGESMIDYILISYDWDYESYDIKMDIKNYQFDADHKLLTHSIFIKNEPIIKNNN